jgi:nitrous oxidase accessory protein NosD
MISEVRWVTVLLAFAITISVGIAASSLTRVAGPKCEGSLQRMIEAAAPGDIVDVPACVYRETVTIDKSITLRASPGSEIRGSDVWTGWEKSGGYWVQGTIPNFPAHGTCSTGTGRCLWPEQVFFDGKPLEQVAANPMNGQFAVDSDRNVVLADDPAGHVVEVTTRTSWVTGEADHVVIEGFAMKHAANDAQNGAIENNGHSHWRIQDNVLSDAHGAIVSLIDGTDLDLLDNDIHRGGQLGVHVSTGDVLVRGNKIHDNNTESFDPGWEAGGVKTAGVLRAGGQHSFVADRNEVYGNDGKGLWCDVGCTNVVYSNNRVHHNERNGIQLEFADGAEVYDNVVWENGWSKPGWGWGAGILASSSREVEIRDNTLAWNADGIAVISQNRDGTSYDDVVDVDVHHNSILQEGYSNVDPRYIDAFALAWLQDWGGVLFDPASDNEGYDNAYWFAMPDRDYWYVPSEEDLPRYAWDGENIGSLSSFNATPGEERGRYLTDAQRDALISSAGIPAFPELRQTAVDGSATRP